MSQITFENIGIKAISAAVPSNIVKTIEQTNNFSEEWLNNFIHTTGIRERRITPPNLTASNLCESATYNLFNNYKEISKSDIDCLIFVSQTPDYRMPNTACLLQNRLGLSTGIYCLDINQACSGYIWGLISSYALCNSGFNNILLLVGDTPSKFLSDNDSSSSLMFGDAGTATLIGHDKNFGKSYFSFNTDGSYQKAVYIPRGGYKNMSCPEGFNYTTNEDGNSMNEEQIHMDGLEVFSTSIKVMTKDIRNLLAYSQKNLDDIDTVILHQANRFMNNKISTKLNIPSEKEIWSIENFGNTSCASIPLNIAFNKGNFNDKGTILLGAIGASFTWASAILKLHNLVNCSVIEV